MVLVFAIFCMIASVVALAVYSLFFPLIECHFPCLLLFWLSISSLRRSACWREGFGVRLVQTRLGVVETRCSIALDDLPGATSVAALRFGCEGSGADFNLTFDVWPLVSWAGRCQCTTVIEPFAS